MDVIFCPLHSSLRMTLSGNKFHMCAIKQDFVLVYSPSGHDKTRTYIVFFILILVGCKRNGCG